MLDVQADRVIDRLFAERERVQNIAAQAEGQQITEKVDQVDTKLAEAGAREPSRRSDIQKIIEEKGEVSVDDVQRLIAKNARRGL